jgi:hypothetical protein
MKREGGGFEGFAKKYFKPCLNVPKFKMINEEQSLEIRNHNKISHACNSTEAI